MDLQKVSIIGNLTRDPEMRYSGNGNQYTRFTVACNQQIRNREGQYEDLASFYNCVTFGKLAEIIAMYAKKGNKIYVEGTLAATIWEGNDNNPRINLDVNSTQAILVGSPLEDADYIPEKRGSPVSRNKPQDIEEDEIPF